MGITFNLFRPQNAFMKSPQQHKTTDTDITRRDKSSDRRDSVSISSEGRMMSIIERLKEQKKSIIGRKNELTAKTLESGGDMENVKLQMDVYSKQLTNIDKEISNIYAQQAKQMMEKFKTAEAKPKENSDNKTKEEVEVKNLTKIANLSESVKLRERVSACKDKADTQVRILESEITLDELDVERLENKGLASTINVRELINNRESDLELKGEVLDDLEAQASNLAMIEGVDLGEFFEKVVENNKTNVHDEKIEKSDELQVSDEAQADDETQATDEALEKEIV